MSKPLLGRRAFLYTTMRLGAVAIFQHSYLAISVSAPAAAQAIAYGAGAYGAGAYGLGDLSASVADQRSRKEA